MLGVHYEHRCLFNLTPHSPHLPSERQKFPTEEALPLTHRFVLKIHRHHILFPLWNVPCPLYLLLYPVRGCVWIWLSEWTPVFLSSLLPPKALLLPSPLLPFLFLSLDLGIIVLNTALPSMLLLVWKRFEGHSCALDGIYLCVFFVQ